VPGFLLSIDPGIASITLEHYHPLLDQVRTWLEAAGLCLEEDGNGHWYEHIIVRKE
jgi:hypothetical protein